MKVPDVRHSAEFGEGKMFFLLVRDVGSEERRFTGLGELRKADVAACKKHTRCLLLLLLLTGTSQVQINTEENTYTSR